MYRNREKKSHDYYNHKGDLDREYQGDVKYDKKEGCSKSEHESHRMFHGDGEREDQQQCNDWDTESDAEKRGAMDWVRQGHFYYEHRKGLVEREYLLH